jgi:hypothetical protein
VSRNTMKRPAFLALSLICFVICIIAFSGLILRADVTGRIIFAAVWAALGVVWLGSYFGAFFGQVGGSPKNDGAASSARAADREEQRCPTHRCEIRAFDKEGLRNGNWVRQ